MPIYLVLYLKIYILISLVNERQWTRCSNQTTKFLEPRHAQINIIFHFTSSPTTSFHLFCWGYSSPRCWDHLFLPSHSHSYTSFRFSFHCLGLSRESAICCWDLAHIIIIIGEEIDWHSKYSWFEGTILQRNTQKILSWLSHFLIICVCCFTLLHLQEHIGAP